MGYVLIIVIIAVTISCIISSQNVKERQEIEEQIAQNRKKQRQIEREEYDKALAVFSSCFGECSINENLGNWDDYRIEKRVLIFEQSSIIIINSKEYKFSDILGYSLVDDATSETITTSTGTAKTSTGSMLGRAVVGGVLTGGLGAVAGAATAKKNITDKATSQTTTTHKYTLYINVNSLQEPTIALKIGPNASKAQKLAGAINVIIERNKN